MIKLQPVLLVAAICCLVTGCASERWQLSTIPRKRDFEIRRPQDFIGQENVIQRGTNEVLHLEPGANLIDYGYDAQTHALQLTLQVNRDGTITVGGPHAGSGKAVRLLNLKRLPRSIRILDSTGGFRVGYSCVVPPEQRSGEQTLTLLLGISLTPPGNADLGPSTKLELAGTLQDLMIYDYNRDRIVVEWTRQAQQERPKVEEEPSADKRPND